MHKSAVIRNRVDHFILVCPPIAERRYPGAMSCNRFGDLVAFQPMLKCCDLETVIVGDAHQHENLILSVGVRMNEPSSVQNLHDSVEFQVPAWRDLIKLLLRFFHFLFIVTSGAKLVANDLFDPHPCLRISRCISFSPIRLLYVFTKREFDALRSAFELHVICRHSPTKLHNLILAADRICGSMEQVSNR